MVNAQHGALKSVFRQDARQLLPAPTIMNMPLPPPQLAQDSNVNSAVFRLSAAPQPEASAALATDWPPGLPSLSHKIGLHTPAHTGTAVELWQVHALSIHSHSFTTLAVSSLSMLLAFLGVRICQLTNLLRHRDRQIKNMLAGEVLLSETILPEVTLSETALSETALSETALSEGMASDALVSDELSQRDTAAYRKTLARRETTAYQARPSTLHRALSTGLNRQELRVYYQPIVDLKAGRTTGFEALVRWQHPKLGLLRPQAFLPAAEKTALMIDIDRWVFEQVCRQLLVWQSEGLFPSLNVNFSGAHFSQPDVVETVEALLSRSSINPAQLTIEVTENVMIANPKKAAATLRQLQRLGLGLSLDDFGTGYSSLAYLSQLPVNSLKIDRSFISALGLTRGRGEAISDESTPELISKNEVIVRSILRLAAELDLEVVAEGCEHLAQRRWLLQQHCTYGQGNLFSGAMTGEAARALLTTANSYSY